MRRHGDRRGRALQTSLPERALGPGFRHRGGVGYTLRYFADAPVTLKAISAGLTAGDPSFKIDGGELTHGGDMLGEIEINSAGSDLFGEELQMMIGALERSGQPAAHHVIQRLRTTRSIVAVRVQLDGNPDPNRTLGMLTPIWPVLGRLSTGLAQIDGQGFYDGATPIVSMP